jgi:hypothetical protein
VASGFLTNFIPSNRRAPVLMAKRRERRDSQREKGLAAFRVARNVCRNELSYLGASSNQLSSWTRYGPFPLGREEEKGRGPRSDRASYPLPSATRCQQCESERAGIDLTCRSGAFGDGADNRAAATGTAVVSRETMLRRDRDRPPPRLPTQIGSQNAECRGGQAVKSTRLPHGSGPSRL